MCPSHAKGSLWRNLSGGGTYTDLGPARIPPAAERETENRLGRAAKSGSRKTSCEYTGKEFMQR